MSALKNELRAHLAQAEGMAFARVADCRELIERFHALPASAKRHPDFPLLEKLYGWMFVPLSLWPGDVRGLGVHVARCIEMGRELDSAARLNCRLVPAAPPDTVCDPVSAHEHAVKLGNYEGLIKAQHKFDLMEKELAKNPELKADWDAIKAEFKVDGYRNPAGIIRRRLAQERNFRPRDWKFAWETEAQRFQIVFDAFCHKWDLWAVEGRRKEKGDGRWQETEVRGQKAEVRGQEWEDRPLLMKLTVNLTQYGTIIMVPR